MARGQHPGPHQQPFGFAAALMAAMAAEGVDLEDPDAVTAWMNGFNDRSYDERAAVLSDDLLGIGTPGLGTTGIGPDIVVELPEESEARASAAQSQLLAHVRGLVDFIGDGRKVTQTGAVTLADARELVVRLGTGDRIDETIGERTFKTRSAADLPALSFAIRVATKARFIRVVKGKLTSTKNGRSIGRDPLEDLVRLTQGLDELGLVTARTAGGRYIWTSIAPFFDDLFGPLAVTLLEASRPLLFDEIVEWAFGVFEEEINLDDPSWTEDRRRDLVESEMRIAMKTLESAGIAVWASETKDLGHGIVKRTAGTVTLTAGGRWALYRYLPESHGIPLTRARPPEYAHLDFASLVLACERSDANDFQNVMREIHAWLEARGDDAMAGLIDSARTTDDEAIRNMALAVLGEQFGPAAEPAVRSLLDVPAARASALLWLVDHALEPADSLLDPDPAVFVDVLTLVLVSRGPASMVDVFEHLGTGDAQLATLQWLWRQPSPAVAPVLETLGRHHPTPAIAKAARKAAMQHASHHAARRR